MRMEGIRGRRCRFGLRFDLHEFWSRSVVSSGVGSSDITLIHLPEHWSFWRICCAGDGEDVWEERSDFVRGQLCQLGLVSGFGWIPPRTQPESLILAQNERWRHA